MTEAKTSILKEIFGADYFDLSLDEQLKRGFETITIRYLKQFPPEDQIKILIDWFYEFIKNQAIYQNELSDRQQITIEMLKSINSLLKRVSNIENFLLNFKL